MRGRLCFSKKIFITSSILTSITLLIFLYTLANTTLLSKKNSTTTQAVYGGTTAAQNAYPYFVKLRTTKSTCSGVLIHHSYILTAAHCVDFITKDPNGGHVFALFGVNTYSDEYKGHYASTIVHTNERPTIFIHDKYMNKPIHQYDEHDIALIRLPSSLFAIPVPSLPDSSQLITSLSFKLIGIGTASIVGQNASKTLQEGSLRVVSYDEKSLTFNAESVSNTVQTGCPGDSGGPAIATINLVPTVIGITSGGYCNIGKKTVFASVPSYRSWITNIIGSQPPYQNTIGLNSIYPTQYPLSPICVTKSFNDCWLYIGMCQWNKNKSICEVVQ